jgi:hypothetical protein
LRQSLDQLLVVAAGRPNGDAQHFRAKRKIERARGGDKNEDAGKQDEERKASPLLAKQERIACSAIRALRLVS